ncbi:hypothetical protein REC12_07140 [Desulfosporosinus sp. PR]|uniref:hypothetical protein n=1 Tax=Candidatus Desulfosporosinus nitrosoreducens TaxID=3401928 RepID=UPI0027E78E90|nr:hypothetical protein [Desulfosporosinus sp. PR]MDQ7093361.1 hypothetical protein [Desulfosporosinus sp. PR]
MDEHEYIYQLRPLVIPGLFFLIIYPVVLGCIYLFNKMPGIELKVLAGIYIVSLLGILALWIIGKSKRVLFKNQQIIFRSLLGDRVLEPKDIRRVAFYFDGKGQEIAQIRTGDVYYYMSEFYFPFPELMSDLENFIRQHGLRSNLQNYSGLNE